MKRLTAFSVEWQSWGLISSCEISKHITTISRSKCIVRHRMFNATSKEPIEDREYMVPRELCESFFTYLGDVAHVSDWHGDYSIDVCDGWHWDARVRFSDHTVKHLEGTVEPPPYGKEITDRILALAEYSEQPLLF